MDFTSTTVNTSRWNISRGSAEASPPTSSFVASLDQLKQGVKPNGKQNSSWLRDGLGQRKCTSLAKGIYLGLRKEQNSFLVFPEPTEISSSWFMDPVNGYRIGTGGIQVLLQQLGIL